jgi:hypothetical protein
MENIEALTKYIDILGLSQIEFAKKIKYNETSLCKIIKKKLPMTKPFKRKFMLSEGFDVEELLIKGKDSRVNKTKEGKKMETELETIKKWIKNRIEGMNNKERLVKLQNTIDDWEIEDIKKRRLTKSKSLKEITT